MSNHGLCGSGKFKIHIARASHKDFPGKWSKNFINMLDEVTKCSTDLQFLRRWRIYSKHPEGFLWLVVQSLKSNLFAGRTLPCTKHVETMRSNYLLMDFMYSWWFHNSKSRQTLFFLSLSNESVHWGMLIHSICWKLPLSNTEFDVKTAEVKISNRASRSSQDNQVTWVAPLRKSELSKVFCKCDSSFSSFLS